MPDKSLTERLRASPTSDIMLEAADALDEAAQNYAALLEDYKELESQLAAVGAGGVSPIMGQPTIRALLAERDALREALKKLADWAEHEVGVDVDLTPGLSEGRAALAQEQGDKE